MALQVIADGRDLTGLVEALNFSNRDPGGFEACSFTLPADLSLRRGSTVRVVEGLGTCWEGRVAEDAVSARFGQATEQVAAQGYGSALRDRPYRMVYVAADFGEWGGASVQRRINVVGASFSQRDPSTVPDATTLEPALRTGWEGAWVAGAKGLSEAWLDAGPGLTLASLYYAWKVNANVAVAGTDWQLAVHLSSTDTQTSIDDAGDILTASPGTGTLTATLADRRFAVVKLLYNTGAAGTDGTDYSAYWTALAAYGPHGLTKRGTAGATSWQGFYPSDIARHALSKATGVQPGVIDEASGFIVPHLVYREPTAPEQVIDEMAKLMGWHWGVWEAPGILGGLPRLDFRPPPSDATAVVSRGECENLDITERLDGLYDTAHVTYNDPAGSGGLEEVTVPNVALDEAGLTGRILPLSMGQGTPAGAETFGRFALLLSQTDARGAGSATLPANVRLPGGGSKPAHLLRAGLDRLRITDLPDAGPVTDTDTRRRDTFRVTRVETTVDRGVPKTRVELDAGSNLLDTLTARLAFTGILARV